MSQSSTGLRDCCMSTHAYLMSQSSTGFMMYGLNQKHTKRFPITWSCCACVRPPLRDCRNTYFQNTLLLGYRDFCSAIPIYECSICSSKYLNSVHNKAIISSCEVCAINLNKRSLLFLARARLCSDKCWRTQRSRKFYYSEAVLSRWPNVIRIEFCQLSNTARTKLA